MATRDTNENPSSIGHRKTADPQRPGPSAAVRSDAIKSNWIELEIAAPDPSWQRETLTKIRQALDTGKPLTPNVPDLAQQSALTQLRYLGTEEAAHELARRLRGEDNHTDFECMFGLIGSPHRDTGLEEMNRLFENSDFPITRMFLTTMSILPLNSSDEPETLRAEMEANRKLVNRDRKSTR